MKVNVAGAGAGKTTKMADLITEFYIPEGKIVFCIAFTNAAADNIENKVAEKLGSVPNNIKISTIHSFLYQELIAPFYYFLYRKHFEQLSVIELPNDQKYKRTKLSELENGNVLHYTLIPEKAKWVVYQKSGDTKAIKELRKKLLDYFAGYCAAIFVDEAQDISKDIKHILDSLNQAGIDVVLYGDPKQDVKGLGCFKEIIDNTTDVRYIPDCFRCPQIHLNLSNKLATDAQRQVASKHNAAGSLEVVFESDIDDVRQLLYDGNYGLHYISMKRDRFETHEKQEKNKRFEALYHEVYRAMADKWDGVKSEIEIRRAAFYITEKMLEAFDKGVNVARIISEWVKTKAFNSLPRQKYAQMASVFQCRSVVTNDIPVVSSIESIKGLEAERCLFILTTDLAPYLFGKKTEDNKTSHLLYVALTRSLDNLTILVTKEVEAVYTKAAIVAFFNSSIRDDET